MEEVKAWLECALKSQGRGVVDDRTQDIGADENKLLKALKAADFLRDLKTTAAIQRRLLLSIVGDCVHAECELKPPPSTTECARAYRIVEAVPPHLLPGVLAAATRDATRRERDVLFVKEWSKTKFCGLPDERALVRLLQLLPRSLHPTIVRECCRRPSDEGLGLFCFPKMPTCRKTCYRTQRDPDAADIMAMEVTGVVERGTCGPSSTGVLFQLLAAAAPLAGGDTQIAWDPGALEAVLSGAADASRVAGSLLDAAAKGSESATSLADIEPEYDNTPSAKRLCVQQGGGWAAAKDAAVMSRLTLTVSSSVCDACQFSICDSPTEEPPRWCAALAQLRVLRGLSITTYDITHLSPAALGPALLALPALEALEVRCEDGYEEQDEEALNKPQDDLLHAIGNLTRLSSLALTNCFHLGNLDDDELEPLSQVSQLSRLTRLTSLTATWLSAGEANETAFVDAVKQMTALRILDVGMLRCWGHDESSEVVLRLVRATELTALQSLAIFNLETAGRLHEALIAANPALLSRLTSLSLPLHDHAISPCDDEPAANTAAVVALLADMPELRSLRVGFNDLGDAGLERLAATLPRLPHLTRLAVCSNDASHVGVTAILEAAGQLQAAAGTFAQGLRELDISGNDLSAANVAQLARLLSRLYCLEALNLDCTVLMESAWHGIVAALRTLPQLRRLRVNRPRADEECRHLSQAERKTLGGGVSPAATLFAGLGHVCID